MRLTGRDLLRLAGMFGALGAVAACFEAFGLRWQHTESLPRGLYRLDRDAPIVRGSISLWCLDEAPGRWARERGYLTRGQCPGEVEPLGKVVLALAGDTVDWRADGVRLNGRPIPLTVPIRRDRAGRALEPIAFGRYVIPSDGAWLYSPYSARSLDSRYLGVVRLGQNIGVVRLVWLPSATLPQATCPTVGPWLRAQDARPRSGRHR